MPRKVHYDTKCYELADSFLSDEPHLATTDRTEELAALIQTTIEDFIEHEKRNYDGAEPHPAEEAGWAANH